MSDALEEHDEKVSLGGRTITNLPMTFCALAEEELEESLDKTCTRFKLEMCWIRPN